MLIALALAACASAIGILFYLVPLTTAPYANRVADYILHQYALDYAPHILPRVPSYEEPNDSLAIVAIDETSALGNPQAGLPQFPFPRGVYGRLLDRLAKAGAKTVVFDVDFLERSADPAQDRAFAAGMHKVPTVLAYVVNTTSGGNFGIEPVTPDLAHAAAATGYSTVDTPGGYVIGQPPQIRTTDGKTYQSLASAAIATLAGRTPPGPPLYDGRLLYLPLHETAAQSLAQSGERAGAEKTNIRILQSMPFAAALTVPIGGLRTLVNGRLVVVGATAQALGDFATTATGRMEGLYINARMMDQLLTRTFIRPVPVALDLALIVILPLLLGAALAQLRPSYGIALCALAIIAYSAITVALYAYRLVWLDLLHVAGAMLLATLAVALYRVVTEGAQRRVVTEMFGMHVSPAVVDVILQADDPRASLHLAGKRVKATIFYSDIRGFTAMSETMTPEAIYDQLNEYFEVMCEVIFKHGGYVDKFIGDCIMAVFSAPFQTPDDAANAVRSAVAQQTIIEQLSDKWQAAGKKPFTVGMGINTGPVVMGNLGATSRMNYTVIGDDVNIAARLYNVATGGQIVISETTYEEVRDLVEARELEPVSVKGKSAPLRIFEVLRLKTA
jgi:adenylate cyclase